MTALRDKLTDAASLGQRIADLPDRETVEELLFSAVTRLAFLHEVDSCSELDRLIRQRRDLDIEMRLGRRT